MERLVPELNVQYMKEKKKPPCESSKKKVKVLKQGFLDFYSRLNEFFNFHKTRSSKV
jgi:hypothetical protein